MYQFSRKDEPVSNKVVELNIPIDEFTPACNTHVRDYSMKCISHTT